MNWSLVAQIWKDLETMKQEHSMWSSAQMVQWEIVDSSGCTIPNVTEAREKRGSYMSQTPLDSIVSNMSCDVTPCDWYNYSIRCHVLIMYCIVFLFGPEFLKISTSCML